MHKPSSLKDRPNFEAIIPPGSKINRQGCNHKKFEGARSSHHIIAREKFSGICFSCFPDHDTVNAMVLKAISLEKWRVRHSHEFYAIVITKIASHGNFSFY